MTDIPEAALIARQMYIDRKTYDEIHFTTGLTKHQLYFWLDGGPIGEDGNPILTAIERRLVRPRRTTARERAAAITNAIRGCNVLIGEIVNRKDPTDEQRDRDGRRMAMVTKALDALTTLEERNREMTRRKKAKNEHFHSVEQPLPQDIEELERSLARKLDAIVAGRGEAVSGESQQT